jgi:hypothetical protein
MHENKPSQKKSSLCLVTLSGEFEVEFETALGYESGNYGGSIHERNRG